jgi:hypothetical protein
MPPSVADRVTLVFLVTWCTTRPGIWEPTDPAGSTVIDFLVTVVPRVTVTVAWNRTSATR